MKCRECNNYKSGWCKLWEGYTKANDECDDFEEKEEDEEDEF